MCGIAMIYAYERGAPPVRREELVAIRDAMTARGPDGAGLWLDADERVGLAHRRLSIVDLSDAAAQPMRSPDGALTIVFNGEIYNYRELRRGLEAAGHVFRTASDTEVILVGYRAYGERIIERLRGMFAFGIWDASRGAALLARDHFGIKPLYMHAQRGTVRVASQVRALLAGGSIRARRKFTSGSTPTFVAFRSGRRRSRTSSTTRASC